MKVGDHPVAVARIDFGPYFNGDLAVANAGDGTISILEWHETGGECAGQPAKLTELTDDDDYWNRGGNPNQVRGLDGNDRISTHGGRDCVSGGKGRDEIDGGMQDDRLSGGPGDDRMTGFRGNDVLWGGPGDDLICQGQTLYRCWGRRSIAYWQADKGSTNRLAGGPGDDRIVSGHGRDRIFGGPGDDRISSRRGSSPDRIVCGSGGDVVLAKRSDRLDRCEVVRYRTGS